MRLPSGPQSLVDNVESISYSRLMSISREEFLRILPVALAPEDHMEIKENGVHLILDGEVVHITLMPQPRIAIASLRLPSLLALISIQASIPGTFMSRFDRVFQRGGG